MSHENQSLSSGTVPEQVKELLHRYEAVCVKLEEMPHSAISDVETQTESLRMEFENLPALPEEYAEIFNKRFAAAVKTVGLFAEEIAAKNNELKKLLDAADAIISAGATFSFSTRKLYADSISEIACVTPALPFEPPYPAYS